MPTDYLNPPGYQPPAPVPTSPTFGLADLQAWYNQYDRPKTSDAPRAVRGLSGDQWTADQLRGVNTKWMTPRSSSNWDEMLNALVAATAQPAPMPGSPAAGPTGPQFSDYTPPMGPVQGHLNDLLLGGVDSFRQAPGEAETLMMNYLRGGPASFTPGAGTAEERLNALLSGGPGSLTPGAGAIESRIAGMSPGSLTPAASAGENALLQLLSDPTLNALARGEVPAATMAHFHDQLARQNAGVIESMGTAGQRFGSGITDTLARTDNEALNALLAGAEDKALQALGLKGTTAQGAGGLANQRLLAGLDTYARLTAAGVDAETARSVAGLNAYSSLSNAALDAETRRSTTGMNTFANMGSNLMGQQSGRESNAWNNYLGLGGGLLSSEVGQGENAQQRMFQDYLQSLGLPPEIAQLIQLAGPMGGSINTKTTSGGGGGSVMGPALALALSYLTKKPPGP